MNKSVALVPVILAIFGGAVWGLMVANSKPGRWSRFPNQLEIRERKERERKEREGIATTEPAVTVPKSSDAVAAATPAKNSTTSETQNSAKVAIEEPLYNFGAMSPFSKQRHKFTFRNEGTETLTLKAGPTTCKCTACDILTPSVAPGAEGYVELEWKTVGRKIHYRHGATVFTNDPKSPEVRLVVEGAVRTHLGAEPSDFTLPRVNPSEAAEASTVVYSQAWESFSIQNLHSTMENLKWELEPATSEELKPHGAKSGYVIKITLPQDLPSGDFNDKLEFEVIHDGNPEDKPLKYEIGLQGKVLRRLAIHGTGIDQTGTIRFDTIDPEVGGKIRLVMKLHDSQLELPVTKIVCDPEFVEAKITSYKPSGKEVGLYYLDVVVPPGIAPMARAETNPGTIHVDFDHPRVKDLDLKLEFIVASPE